MSKTIFDRQAHLGSELERLFTNYKKDSSSRKTESYLKERLQKLEAIWTEFQENHKSLQDIADTHKDHPYFEKLYFDNAKAIYDQYKCQLTGLLNQKKETQSLQQGAPTDTTTKDTITKDITLKDTMIRNNEENVELRKLVRRQKTLMKLIVHTIQDIESNLNTPQSRAYYKIQSDSLHQYQIDMRNYHQSISEIIDTDFEDYDTDYYFELYKWVQDTLILLHERLEINTVSAQAAQVQTSGHVKLPKINIPKFDGNYLQWLQFRDLYLQLVHNQPIDESQKMFYLASNLTGEARRLIQHLPASKDNYFAAWEILCNRYDNKRLLVNELLKRFFSQPTLQQESSSAIKSLHDITTECIMGLNHLGISTDTWDPILTYILTKKLDKNTLTLYEQSLKSPRTLHPLKDLLQFLETRFQSLEAMGSKHKSQVAPTALIGTSSKKYCNCKQQHPLYKCESFKTKGLKEKIDIVKKFNLCFNCLQAGHGSNNCKSRKCIKCGKTHHTLIHPEESNVAQKDIVPNKTIQKEAVNLAASCNIPKNNYVLLGTVKLKVATNNGDYVNCRAILDSGSQTNFITDTLAKKLKLPEEKDLLDIRGLGNGKQQTTRRVKIMVRSNASGFEMHLNAYILPQITGHHPSIKVNTDNWSIPTNIKLADPEFQQPARIDLLIGAEKFFELLNIGQIKLGEGSPTLQNTLFGWVIAGAVQQNYERNTFCGICTQEESKLNEQMEKFWTLEEPERIVKPSTKEHIMCETYFNQTVQRDENGRFIVRLPFSCDPENLGQSKDKAIARLHAMERKFKRDNDLKQQYKNFMDEYLRLNHMKEVPSNDVPDSCYYLPHHCVLKPQSSTTKLRVVFDASAKTSLNTSLNDILYTGPKVQNDIFSVLIRFRLPRYVFTADIEKMYRQILVHPNDRKYQMIVWRDHDQQSLRYFELQTVTYGITTAPYLAIKCLQRLADENRVRYPLGATCIAENMYVDDAMAGSDNLDEALQKRDQLNNILLSAGFKLRKWCVNHPALWHNISSEDRSSHLEVYEDDQYHIKTLGLSWFPKYDEFLVTVNEQQSDTKVTKRRILADIAHLFDPLGLLNPVIVSAKLILQKLWELKLDWDAAVPMEMHSRWCQFRSELTYLRDIKVSRHIFNHEVPKSVQMHAFCDASEQAYGAAVYIRSVLMNGTITMRLLCAKSRLAPLKKVTLPRLELCAAKLCAELVNRVKQDLHWTAPCHFWSDSMIVLAWINSTSAKYHTFVANRIATIQELSFPEQWHHVASKENPADLLSRGVTPRKLRDNNLWFYGPPFLYGPENRWNAKQMIIETELERKHPKTTLAASTVSALDLQDIKHCNSFSRLQRIIAYVHRFIKIRDPSYPKHGPLIVKELEAALLSIIKIMQSQEFGDDYVQLEQQNSVNAQSPLLSLTPFMDEQGIIRVGGRLENAKIGYDAKHPMLLPYSHFVTKLIFTELHERNSHVGPQALLALSRQRFWAIKGKTLARSVVQNCVRCTKVKPKFMSQLMGNLPAHRVQPARPFMNTGVDFCGPFWVHSKGRGSRTVKAYVAIFCCFSTKAVHIEVVSDLTTEAFVGALKRFIGRRGHCRNVYCDNATNFIGTNNQLQELQQIIYEEKATQDIIKFCGTHNIDFHFIPPRAPHFGGLWEAAVKSAKDLFKRSIMGASLTYEELTTTMVEIEAILNSRPLTPMSTNPNDLTALTPGHFLVGEPLTSVVDAHARPLKGNMLYRWKLVATLKREFWERWTREYLAELQHRHKWRQQCNNAHPGTMVIVKEDNTPVLSWPLGRIIEVIKGNDGLVRVANVKTANGILKRPIHKLAPLPIDAGTVEDYDAVPQPTKRHATETSEEIVTQSDSGNEQNRRGKRRRSNTAVGLLLTTCLLLPTLGSTQTIIKPFTTQPGIYFESIGLARLITDNWKLVVYFNMSKYWDELEHINQSILQLQNMCNKVHDSQTCNLTIQQFKQTMSDIQSGNELLHARKRYKRAPLDIIGNIASSLFGVLDSAYAEKMATIIENLDNNQHQLLELLKNQTSIVDSTVNIFNKSQKAMKLQIQRFNTHISAIQSEVKDQKLIESFNALSTQLILVISSYQKMQIALMDIIIDTHHGKLNPLLLTPRQLQYQLAIVREHLPPTVQLPLAQDNLLAFYNLMSVESYVTTTRVIFRINIPLLSMEVFELLQLTSVPTMINNTFISILPATKYLLVNLHRELYYPITEGELEKCLVSKNKTYLCIQHQPLYKKGSSMAACEISILTQTTIPRTCLLINLVEPTSWIPLHQQNHWIYVMNGTTTITILCGHHNVTQYTLFGSGTLELMPGCILRDKTTTIQAHNLYYSSTSTSFIISTNFTSLLNPSALDQMQFKPEAEQSMFNNMTELKQRIEDLKTHEHLLIKGQKYDIHHFALGYLTLVVIIVMAIYIIQHHVRLRQKTGQRKQPVPAASRHQPEAFEFESTIK